MFAFEKLEVWQDAQASTCRIYQITENFPKREQFLLTDQIRRSSSSISANIAEGNARQSNKEKAHFTTIAYGSLMETFNHLLLASKLQFISKDELQVFRKSIEKIAHQLQSLRKYQLSIPPS